MIRLKDFENSAERIKAALALYPDFARAHEILGELFVKRNQLEQAVQAFTHAIHLSPDSSECHRKLVTVLTKLGRAREAAEATEKFRRRNPAAAALAEALRCERDGNLDKAERIYRKILMREPGNVDALWRIGVVAIAGKQYVDAEVFLRRAVDLAPDFAQAWADLVVAQMELEKYDQAVVSAGRMVRMDPSGTMPHLFLANSLAMSGRHDEALAEYRFVTGRVPGHPVALSGMAHLLKTVGRQDESIAAYLECIRANPRHTEAWWGLANMKTYEFKSEEIEAMLRLLRDGDAKAGRASSWLTSTPEVNICISLGVAFEQRGEYQRAFEFFARGNKRRRLDEPYDPYQTEQLHDRIIEVFNRDFLEGRSRCGNPDASAIFIVGLPRTGSTLIEQILASHRMVEGTHELPELGELAVGLSVHPGIRSQYPDGVEKLDNAALYALGQEYIVRTRKYRMAKPFFTDKNLGNFVHVGLLHLILPNAKIINVRRHPLDSCLGCYKQLFARGMPFSYDLEELGEYYVQYQRLMDHWVAVLPGKVLQVQYEDVVSELPSQVRRILDHCGLPWDDRCLRFHKTRRDVRTASSEQVRQPIYRSSIGLWRHYEPCLGKLIDILAPELLKLPKDVRPEALQAAGAV